VNAAGNRINYNITVRNTGNVLLTSLSVVDTRVTSLFCRPVGIGSNLPTGSSTVCTGSYDVTQADINAGLALVNTATVKVGRKEMGKKKIAKKKKKKSLTTLLNNARRPL
jgi:hypothetical protein